MEGGAGGSAASPARAATGGICDRLLTFLANGLSMNRPKSLTDGPRTVGSGGGYRQLEEEDEFAIRIERAEFELTDHEDDAHTTVLEGATSTAAAIATDEQQQQQLAAADVAADPPAAVGETKIRKTVTIKEDRPEEGKGAPALERKKSLFRKRQASTSSSGGGAGAEERAPRRSGLRPRMPGVLRVPSNINEKSSTFIEERRKSFGGKTAAGK